MHIATGYPLGKTPSERRDIPLPAAQRLRHVYVVGQSGSGKTAALRTWMWQDIEEAQAFGLIDVEEGFAAACLGYLEHFGVQPERVVVVDPTRKEAVVPLNFLATPAGADPYVVVEDLVFSMRRAWADVWGPRLDDILRHALLLLQEHQLTLGELPRLLSDKKFREYLAQESNDERLRLFFLSHLGNVPEREWRVWIEAVRNKASAFAGNPFIEPMIAADACLDFRAIMDEGKYLVVNIPERVLKDSGRLFGMMIVSRIYAAALQRQGGASPWFLYCDEFQSVASRSFLDIVTRSRKRGVGVVVAHQNLNQPPFDRDPGYLETLLANSATQAFFQMGRKDAERLAPEVFPITGTLVKRQKKHPLWGDFGDPQFYSVQEEREFFASQLEHAKPRECFIKMKTERGTEVWVAETYDLPDVRDQGEALASASVRCHGTTPESLQRAKTARLELVDPKKPSRGRKAAPDANQGEREYQGEPI